MIGGPPTNATDCSAKSLVVLFNILSKFISQNDLAF